MRHREENNFEPLWEIGRNRGLMIHSIKSGPDMGGFGLVALDPWEGKEVELYFHREANGQPFTALRNRGNRHLESQAAIPSRRGSVGFQRASAQLKVVRAVYNYCKFTHWRLLRA